MSRNVELFIKDILEYMERAEEYVKGYSFTSFLADKKTCDSVLRCMEIIGEATKGVPETLRNNYPAVPWRDMAGMRDKVIHGYYVVDFGMVWLVVKEDIPKIKPMIVDLLRELDS
jgi:uncharacterized protein with HEPN domain